MDDIRNHFPIKASERVSVFGATGSGKSYVALKLLQYQTVPFILFDSKPSPTLQMFGWRVVKDIADLTRVGLWPNHRHEKVIFQPPWDATDAETVDLCNGIAKFCYMRGQKGYPIGLYVDEGSDVAPNPNQTPRFIRGLARKGRELNVPLWVATQRPVGVPKVLVSEADWMLFFQLRDPADKERVSLIAERDLRQTISRLLPHQFVALNAKQQKVVGPFTIG